MKLMYWARWSLGRSLDCSWKNGLEGILLHFGIHSISIVIICFFLLDPSEWICYRRSRFSL